MAGEFGIEKYTFLNVSIKRRNYAVKKKPLKMGEKNIHSFINEYIEYYIHVVMIAYILNDKSQNHANHDLLNRMILFFLMKGIYF